MNGLQIKNFIRYNAERIDYTLSGEELEQLKNISSNTWKDFCIACFSFGIPCIINSIVEINNQDSFKVTLSIFLNSISGFLGITLGVFFLISWLKTKKSFSILLDKIEKKPIVCINTADTDIAHINVEKDFLIQK